MMEERLINFITVLLEEYGYNASDIVIDRLLPSSQNKKRNVHEFKIRCRYGKAD